MPPADVEGAEVEAALETALAMGDRAVMAISGGLDSMVLLTAASNLPARRRIERATSGSTGVPFRFAVDRAALPVAFASQLSYDSWIGLRPRTDHSPLPPATASYPGE